MSLLDKTPASPRLKKAVESKKRTLKKFLAFGLIGVLNTGLHTAVLTFALFELQLGYGAGNVIAYLVASTLSFLLNARFAFRVKKTTKRFARFQLIGCINVAVCYLLGEFAEAHGLHYLLLILLTALILPLITFTLHHRFTFK